MEFESDEMFKVLKMKMGDWAKASRIAQTAAAVAQPSAAMGSKPQKAAPQKKQGGAQPK